jgi:Programmed cell death protein 2, C-terminal putative domain
MAASVDNNSNASRLNGVQERHGKNGFCVVCGFPATGRCPLQNQPFCGKEHQRLYKRYHTSTRTNIRNHDQDSDKPWESNLPGVFHAVELVVEEEPPEDENYGESTIADRAEAALLHNTTKNDDNDDDSDLEVEQEDLNAIVTGEPKKAPTVTDTAYQHFMDRISNRPNSKDQVLRYARWQNDDAILWLRTDHRPTDCKNYAGDDDVNKPTATPQLPPHCPYCGAERKFEFQLLPQLLHYLKNDVVLSGSTDKEKMDEFSALKGALQQADAILEQAPPEQIPPSVVEGRQAAIDRIRNSLLGKNGIDNSNKELNWGTMVVYTCTQSCGGDDSSDARAGDHELGAYREEYAWVQPAMDELID